MILNVHIKKHVVVMQLKIYQTSNSEVMESNTSRPE